MIVFCFVGITLFDFTGVLEPVNGAIIVSLKALDH